MVPNAYYPRHPANNKRPGGIQVKEDGAEVKAEQMLWKVLTASIVWVKLKGLVRAVKDAAAECSKVWLHFLS